VSAHLSILQIMRFCAKALRDDEISAVANHVAECEFITLFVDELRRRIRHLRALVLTDLVVFHLACQVFKRAFHSRVGTTSRLSYRLMLRRVDTTWTLQAIMADKGDLTQFHDCCASGKFSLAPSLCINHQV
jgi:hypothetical protein